MTKNLQRHLEWLATVRRIVEAAGSDSTLARDEMDAGYTAYELGVAPEEFAAMVLEGCTAKVTA